MLRKIATGVLAVGLVAATVVVFARKFSLGDWHGYAAARERAAASSAVDAPIQRRPDLQHVWMPPPLPKLTPLPTPSDVSLGQLQRMFPAFHHDPFDTAGFNPLALPFRYQDPDGVGDPAEANAMSFLLSDALDWAPGNYSARHAYFVFSQSADAIRPLAQGYDAPAIASLVHGWSATHAVGGVLRRSRDGCAGTPEIYAADGSLAFQQHCDAPRPYFTLLGDMAVDAIAHFGPPPSPELVALLHAPRCERPESIVRLGMAAFEPLRDEGTFALYAQILQDDPTFAEVRYWWADQKHWDLGDRPERERQVARSLHDRITPTAIATFRPGDCRDAELAGEYPEWVARAARLAGTDAPLTLQLALQQSTASATFHRGLFQRALAAAARYPNRRDLLSELADATIANTGGPLDARLSASLSVAAMSSRYLDGVGDFRGQRERLADAVRLLGRPDLAIAVTEPLGPPEETRELDARVIDLCDAGRFADAVAAFAAAEPIDHDQAGVDAAHWAALAAATVGDAAALARLRDAWGGAFDQSGMTAAPDGYAVAVDPTGNPDVPPLRENVRNHLSDPALMPRIALCAETDLARGRGLFRNGVWQEVNLQPSDRLCWALWDTYERRAPSEYGPSFHRSLAWLYPRDPWVQTAVADWVARGSPVQRSDARALARVVDDLHYYLPDEWPTPDVLSRYSAPTFLDRAGGPWAVADAVRAALASGDRATAHELTLRFRHLAVELPTNGPGVWAGELLDRESKP
jgi:hypothetical protein